MLMIAAGDQDCDDVDALRTDPALKIAVGRAPDSGGMTYGIFRTID